MSYTFNKLIAILFVALFVQSTSAKSGGVIEFPEAPETEFKLICVKNLKWAMPGSDFKSESSWKVLPGIRYLSSDFSFELAEGACYTVSVESEQYKMLHTGYFTGSMDFKQGLVYELGGNAWPYADIVQPTHGSVLGQDSNKVYYNSSILHHLYLSNSDIGRRWPLAFLGKQPALVGSSRNLLVEMQSNPLLLHYDPVTFPNISHLLDEEATRNRFLGTTAINKTLLPIMALDKRLIRWEVTEQSVFTRSEVEGVVENLIENTAIARQQAIAASPLYKYLGDPDYGLVEELFDQIRKSKKLQLNLKRLMAEIEEGK